MATDLDPIFWEIERNREHLRATRWVVTGTRLVGRGISVDKEIVEDGYYEDDSETQAKARAALMDIYRSSPLYLARYEAAKALSIGDVDIRAAFAEWFLESRKRDDKEPARQLAGIELEYAFSVFTSRSRYTRLAELLRGVFLTPTGQDVLNRFRRVDLENMYRSLPKGELPAGIGPLLGYSGLRIWVHNHPGTTWTALLAVVGAALALWRFGS